MGYPTDSGFEDAREVPSSEHLLDVLRRLALNDRRNLAEVHEDVQADVDTILARMGESEAHGIQVRHGHLQPKSGGPCIICHPPTNNAGALMAAQDGMAILLRSFGWKEGPGLSFVRNELEELRRRRAAEGD